MAVNGFFGNGLKALRRVPLLKEDYVIKEEEAYCLSVSL